MNLLLITAAAYFGVRLFYLALFTGMDADASLPPVIREGLSPERGLIQPFSFYKPIMDRDLFQTKNAENKISKTLQVDKLKATALKLKLWGTAIFGEGKGFAIIEDLQGKKQSLYAPGQVVQNATIKMILKDRVVLRVNDKDEILKVEDIKSSVQGPPFLSKVPETVQTEPSQNVMLSRAQIEGALQNVNELMNQINIRPHFLNGQPDGLAVGGIAPDSIFIKMGLRNGDIITGIDGKKIESVDDALKLYDSIKSAKNTAVEIKRLGKTEIISFQIE